MILLPIDALMEVGHLIENIPLAVIGANGRFKQLPSQIIGFVESLLLRCTGKLLPQQLGDIRGLLAGIVK